MRVAAVQFEPVLFRKTENTSALLRLTEEAAIQTGPGGLVVLPEMALTGYVFRSREEIAPYVEPIPGPTTRVLGQLARRRGVSLVVGLAEVAPSTGAFYNSAALIGPGGEVAGVYRKTHTFFADTFWAAEGDLGLPVFRGAWPGPLGLLICMDVGFFEAARVMALGGARVLAVPTNWLRLAPSPEWRARAAENGVYLVVADRWGEERGTRFAGGSCVIGPCGRILAARERGDGVVTAEIDLGRVEAEATSVSGAGAGDRLDREPAALGRLVHRRPSLYHTLLLHPYRWPERYCFGDLGSDRFWLGAGPAMREGAGPAMREGASGTVGDLPGDAGKRLIALPPGRQTSDVPYLLRGAKEAGSYLAVGLGRTAAGSSRPWGEEEVLLVGPEGVLGRYRSPHFPFRDDPSPAAPFPVYDLPFARVGLLHPLDLLLPEPARILAKQGADIVLVSGLWPDGMEDLEFLWAERAETNDLWLAIATQSGAVVYATDGRSEKAVVAGSPRGFGEPGPAGLFVQTGAGAPTRRKDRLRRLRPELYSTLVAPVEPDHPPAGPAGAGVRGDK
jgi:predicted amidohydrolase